MTAFSFKRPGLLGALALLGAGTTGCIGTCFRRGTQVKTSTGSRPIETLEPGDLITTYDPATRKLVEAPVAGRLRFSNRELRILRTNRSETFVTDSHPYFVPGTGFRPVRELHASSPLLATTASGFVQSTSLLSMEPVSGLHDVFNIEVAGLHSYFADDLLVHNKSLPSPCECEYTPAGCAGADFDSDGVLYSQDCDDHNEFIGECAPGELPRRYCWLPDAGALDSGAPDGGAADGGAADGGAADGGAADGGAADGG